MWRPALAILGVLALAGALFALFGGALVASATGTAHRTGNPTPVTTTSPGGGAGGTDADCNGDMNGKQPNGDNSHQFPAGSVPPGVAKHCPPASVPEVPAAAGLFALLGLVSLGFLLKTGYIRIPLTRGA